MPWVVNVEHVATGSGVASGRSRPSSGYQSGSARPGDELPHTGAGRCDLAAGADEDAAAAHAGRPRTRTAELPPKANDEESATRTASGRPRLGTGSTGHAGSASPKRAVGGTIERAIARAVIAASMPPAPHRQWPRAPLTEETGNGPEAVAEDPPVRGALGRVVLLGGGAVGVDVVDVVRGDAGVGERGPHRALPGGSRRLGLGHVEGVVGDAVAADDGVRPAPPRGGPLGGLDDQHGALLRRRIGHAGGGRTACTARDRRRAAS